MAKTYTSVTQRVWQLIAEKPDAIHTILPSQDRATSRARDLRKNSSTSSAANRPGCVGITRAEAGHMIAEATLFLQSKGLSRGDRISILGWDTFHFLALSRAAKGLGLVLAPPHPNSTKEQNVHVLNDSQPAIIIADNQRLIDTLIDLSQFKRVRLNGQEVAADQSGLDDNLPTCTFDEVFKHCPSLQNRAVDANGKVQPLQFRDEAKAEYARLLKLFTTPGASLPFEMSDPVLIIYTSGSTGLPKGVVHTHNSQAAICEMLRGAMPFGEDHIIMHLLPWSHIFGETNGRELAEAMGCINTYAEPTNFKDMLPLIRPHLLLAVPLLWNRLKSEVENQVNGAEDIKTLLKKQGFAIFKKANSAALKLSLAKWALSIRTTSEYSKPEVSDKDGAVMRTLKRIKHNLAHASRQPGRWAARKFICPGILAKAGLDHIVMSVSGSAAIPAETTKFFQYIGVQLREGYGSSESAGGWCVNLLDDFEMGSLGKPLPGAEIRIIPVPGMPEGTGEVEVRGDFMFAGYWRNPGKTAEVFTADGWFKMGDTVRRAANGRLWFEGRGSIKKLLTGEFYSEERVQTALEASPLLSAAVPTGEGYGCIGALLFLDPGAAKRLVGLPSDGSDKWEYWINHPQILAACKEIITAGNKALLEAPESLKWEQVRKFALCPGELTIENGLRTNTNKPKNKEVRKVFAAQVTKMYG